jgi:hypothetical protein
MPEKGSKLLKSADVGRPKSLGLLDPAPHGEHLEGVP